MTELENKTTKRGRPKAQIGADDVVKPTKKIAETQKDLVGMTVSLDLSKSTYYGGEKFWLSPDNPVLEVRSDLPAADLRLIRSALATGTLVEGKKWLPPTAKDPLILQKYLLCIEKNESTETFKADEKKLWASLFLKGRDGGYSTKEIVRHCLAKEKGRKNRGVMVRALEQMIEADQGPEYLIPVPEIFSE
jgi:hypothetical protein